LEISSSKDARMSAVVADARDDLRAYTQRRWPALNLKGRLTKLLRERADRKRHPEHPLQDWSDRRVRAVFNGELGVSLRAHEQAELDALIKEAQHEYRDLAQLASSLQALLFGPEADFYRPQVDAIRAALVPPSGEAAVGGADFGAGDRDRSFAAKAD
jgi:hypothetical protein